MTRWIERKVPLRVSDLNLRCVAFIAEVVGQTSSGEELDDPIGTGFFVGYDSRVHGGSYLYFVTAKHVIETARDRDKLRLIVNKIDGGVTTIEGFLNKWWTHPNDNTVDVAVAPCPLRPLDCFIKTKEFLTPALMKEKNIGIGDEVFMTGLFAFVPGRKQNWPIVRYGNIAMLPDEQIETERGFVDAYLIEARSIGGLSGSPVFARETILYEIPDPKGSPKNVQVQGIGHAYLLGLMHGHWDINEADLNKTSYVHDRQRGVNLGIGIVVPATKILETLNHPDLEKLRYEGDREKSKLIIPGPDIWMP